MHLSNLSKAFQKTPARLKDASLEGMPLHQKQRELKTNVEIAKAEMTRTAPEGIRANNKGDIRIKNNLGPDQIGDRSAYNGACIKYEKANHELNMFNKTNAKGLKDEAKADTKLRKQDGTGALPSPRPLPAVRETAALPAGAVFSVEATAQRLARLVSAGDPDLAHLRDEAATLGSLLGPVREGRDPYVGRTGALRRAWRSPLDGTLQEFSLYVPPRYRASERIALVVGLHGLHGSAHRMLPVLVGHYDESEDRTRAERHLPPMPDTGAILLAPYGYGDSGYRQQGEVDVMAAIDAVAAGYAIDPDRIYLTGLSMGGIGAAGVAFHHPDRFAAIAPLCGYHSYFVRSDTRTVRRPWEVFLMELRSNASYAENGLHLPMYLVHGTLDRPLSNSQVLVDRYQTLGYDAQVEWPPLGHNVWSQTYADGRIVPHFLRYQRDPAPRRVRFRTPELRWNRSAWVTLDALLDRKSVV